jgi:hypothetical protein
MPITIDKFFADSEGIENFGEEWIHSSYREFLNFFSSKGELTGHDMVIGAYFTYGWMPTMLEMRGDVEDVARIANKARTAEGISREDFSSLAFAINGSVVGASKFLHFLCPSQYAIWDSRVYRYFHQQAPYQYRLEAPEAYWDYLSFLDRLAKDKRFKSFKEGVDQSVGYGVSDKRACELLMYTKGGNF